MTRRTLTQDELNAIYREPWCDPACRLLIKMRIESGEWIISDTPQDPRAHAR